MDAHRRTLFALGSTLGLAAIGFKAHAQDDVASSRSSLAGRKFSLQGDVLPFPGDTIICHIAQFTQLSKDLIALRDSLKALPHASTKFRYLPPSSYHMTVFECDSIGRRKPGIWFEDLPLDASRKLVEEYLVARLKDFDLDAQLPIRMRVDLTSQPRSSATLRLLPLNAEEDAKIRRIRKRLGDALKFRMPGDGAYEFHVSLGYQLRPLTAAEQTDQFAILKAGHDRVAANNPVIELNAPEFCTFNDMFAFDHQFFIKNQEDKA